MMSQRELGQVGIDRRIAEESATTGRAGGMRKAPERGR
jgi:hypothetical protein